MIGLDLWSGVGIAKQRRTTNENHFGAIAIWQHN
jgi:hypothetical protein